MQLGAAQRGVSRGSELFDSLKVYLNNKNRLQPIVGLGSITECVKMGAHTREALYLCEVCVCRLSKADMRNHIMGTLHRYNYIRAWHPHLVSNWKESSDLSKLAWPLMELAKTIEGKEGAGDVQLLEVEDTVYQRMATHREKDAVTLINSLRDWQGRAELESHSETTSVQPEHHPIQSQRVVLLSQNQQRQPEKFLKAGVISQKTSAQVNEPPRLPIKSEGWLKNISTLQVDNTQMSPNASVLSENSSFFDGYTGTKPLIGLFRVVECRSEDGCTYVFLCHCCRIRSNKEDIVDHLTSSSHLSNYLMETHPEQMEVMTADVNDNVRFLLSLARRVEREEGRGEPKVINVPESLCIPLIGKSYHWCIKMLCNGWTHNGTQKNKITVKGTRMNKTSVAGMPEKRALVLSKMAKRRKTKRKVANTVFKVSLPVTKGSVLLERTSFSEDGLPVSYSHSSASDLTPSSESETEDCELDCDTGSFAVNHAEHTSVFTTLQPQQDPFSGYAEIGQHKGPERHFSVALYQEVDGHLSDNEYFIQSEDITGRKEQKVYGERSYDRWHGSRERPSRHFNEELKCDGPQKQNEESSPAVSHIQDWSSHNSSHSREQGHTVQWHSSASQSKVGEIVEASKEEGQKEMRSQCYYHQQPQNQYMAPNHTSPLTGSGGHHGLSGELAPCLDAARVNMYPIYPYTGDFLAHSGSVAPAPGVQFPEAEQRPLQTYAEFPTSNVQTTLQTYMRQLMDYQALQIGHWVMSNPNYSNGPWTNPDQHCPDPDSSSSSSSGGGGCMSQSNALTPPVQALKDHSGFHSTEILGRQV